MESLDRGWRRAARWVLGVHLFLSPLAFSPLTLEAFEFNKVMLLRLAVLVVLTVAIGSWFAGARTSLSELRGRLDLLDGALLLFLATAAISAAQGLSPRTSILGADQRYQGLATLLCYALLFAATRWAFADGRGMVRLLGLPVLALVPILAYAVGQIAGHDPLSWTGIAHLEGRARPFSTLGHPNFLGGYLAMVLALAGLDLAQSEDRKPRWRRWAMLPLLCLAALVLLATVSRSAWIASLCVLGALYLGWRRLGLKRPIRQLRRSVRTLATVCILGLAVLAVQGHPVVANFKLRLRRAGQVFDDPRVHIWRASTAVFGERPWLGVGPECLQFAIGRHRDPAYWRMEWLTTPTRAHNETLQLAATEGVVGLAAGAWLVLALGITFRRAWGRQTDPAVRALLVAVGAALAAFLAQNLVGFPTTAPTVLAVTLAALLSAWARPPRAEPDQPRPARPVALALTGVLAGAAAVLLVFLPYLASVEASRAEGLRGRGEIAATVDAAARALALDATQAHYWTLAGAAHFEAARATSDHQRALAHLRQAWQAHRQALRMVEVNPYAWANAGYALAELAALGAHEVNLQQALEAFDRALQLDPSNPYLLRQAGHLALRFMLLDRLELYARRGQEVFPSYGAGHFQMGRLHILHGRWDEAARDLAVAATSEWYEDRPGQAEAWFYKGMVDEQRARAAGAQGAPALLEAARQAYRAALSLDPEHPEARGQLSGLER